MKKIISITSVLMILVSSVFAANMNEERQKENLLELQGKVVDSEAGEALAGAMVIVNGKKTYTDLDGNFKILQSSGSVCEIQVNMISYKSQVVSLNTVGEKQQVRIALRAL